MAFNVAAAYLNNFRPMQPISGFEDVKSTYASELLSQIPLAQFEAELEIAKEALGAKALLEQQRIAERGANKRAELVAKNNRLKSIFNALTSDSSSSMGSVMSQYDSLDAWDPSAKDQRQRAQQTQALLNNNMPSVQQQEVAPLPMAGEERFKEEAIQKIEKYLEKLEKK